MLLVIFGHCAYYKIDTEYGGIDYINDKEDSLCIAYRLLNFLVSFIYTFHMPFFMAISGACFSFVNRKYDGLLSLTKDKWKRLIIPFLIVTTFLSLPCKIAGGYYEGYDNILIQILFGQYLLLGNSHLWFLASLFWVFLSFFIIQRYLPIKVTWTYWIGLMVLYFIGDSMTTNFIGISGCLKHLIFFAFGFYTIEFFNKNKLKNIAMLTSWLLMFIGFALYRCIVSNMDYVIIKSLTLFGFVLWGCINMVFLSKILTFVILGKKFYRILSENSYELYLYSDPFNYVIIGVFISIYGSDVYLSNHISILAFILRFLVTILMSIIIIILHSYIKNYNRLN